MKWIPVAAAAVLLAHAAALSLDSGAAGAPAPLPPVSFAALCAAVAGGQPLTFVDVREPEEFAEEHLPRAVLLPRREMGDRADGRLDPGALIVPYCLKDFRGFEGAKRLRALGFERVRLLDGVGLNGWKAHGMPTAGPLADRSDDEAWQALIERCEAAP